MWGLQSFKWIGMLHSGIALMCTIQYELVIHSQMPNHLGRLVIPIQVHNTFNLYKNDIL